MDTELHFHLAAYAEDLVHRGLPPAEAMRRARLEFGGIESAKEECREARGLNLLENALQDLRFGFRMLRKNPGFTVMAVLTLALGIGANAGVFSVINGVLLNPLPYPHPEQVVALHESKPNFPTGSISLPNFKDWKRNNRTFANIAISRRYSFSLADTSGSKRLSARLVTSGFFTVLGVKPALGRDFAPSEDEIGAAPVAMISSSLWQRQFGGAPSIVGRTIKLDDRGYTVIGVVPAHFNLLTDSFRPADVYVPVGQWTNDALVNRSAGLAFHGLGRLKPGVTLQQARADLASVTHALALEYPSDNKGVGATLIPLREEVLGRVEPILWLLLGAVLLVLLIACVNVGNLLLARASNRMREVAIRSAIGAGVARLIRQLLTESVLLALIGGLLGLALAFWGTPASLHWLPTTLPRSGEVGLDGHVLTFTFLISLLAGILFGLAPALKMLHSDLQRALKEGGRGTTGGKQRTQGLFVALELAMALVLLAGAGLLIRSLSALWSVNPGFQPNGVVTLDVSFPLSLAQAAPEAIRARLRETQSHFAAIPGITAVALSWGALPMLGDDEELFWRKGQPKPASAAEMNWALRYIVGPDYLKAMRIPLRRGRFFTEHDDHHFPLVMVVDEEFAHQFFGREDPIGQRLELQETAGEAEIIGIVAHVKQWGLDTDSKEKLRAQMYVPILQLPDEATSKMVPGVDVIVRCSSSPTMVFEALRRTSASIDHEQVVSGLRTMNEVIAVTLSARRFSMVLLSVFAGVALLLAIIGVYGVTSYSVGRRTNE
ncbi:MAG: ABC transporter permease, partial [Acidobacteriia bacterium]|nr:ABC transporter permease [Terriglobia bacterium]